MPLSRVWTAAALVLCLAASVSGGQTATVPSSQAAAFMGTWVMAMTNPAGATETVRIWDQKGVVAASVQSGKSPAIAATGIMKDGDVLVLTLTRFENGKQDRAVIALTVDGETLNMAQMLEFSQTIKRGSGKKQFDPPVK
jgi:hypothetical protein